MCISPVILDKNSILINEYRMEKVPCGKCVECRKQRVNSWYIRLLNERKVSCSAKFVTLTYDDSCIPFSDNGLMTLQYSDFQKFVKRLRKKYRSDRPIKYFCVGEYGANTYRPHYHVIMFNVKSDDYISNCWNLGFTHIGDVTDQSIYYTLKYCTKNILTSENIDEDDDRVSEKALMSKGLGLSFLTPAMIKYYKSDVSRGVTLPGNRKLPLPRYYRDKLFSDSEKALRLRLLSEFSDHRYELESDPLFPQRVERMNEKIKEKILKTD